MLFCISLVLSKKLRPLPLNILIRGIKVDVFNRGTVWLDTRIINSLIAGRSVCPSHRRTATHYDCAIKSCRSYRIHQQAQLIKAAEPLKKSGCREYLLMFISKIILKLILQIIST